MAVRLRAHRRPSKWATIPEPGPGARFRGYLRYSERDLYSVADKTTFQLQRDEMERYARARGWLCVGWDEEPAISGAAEDISLRPAFAKHLADAAAGLFDVSLCFMTDRWARDTAIGLDSLKRLRRAGVYWATCDGRWDINKVIEDGHSVAFVVDAEINASYARKVSQKAILSRRATAHAGFHNGRLTWGYQRAPSPPAPADAPLSWKPPRQAPIPHPINFARLQQIGEWAAAGASDREIADRAATAGWVLEHRTKGVVRWGKPFVCALLTNSFPREFAPGSGRGTILAPDGERVEGKHPAAWSWELWHRIDEARALNAKGTRGRSPAHGVTRVFSGVAVCGACGRPLHHQLRRGPVSGWYSVYLCSASDTAYPCPLREAGRVGSGERGSRGFRAVRSSDLEEQIASLVLDWALPSDWRERIAEEVNRRERGGAQLDEAARMRSELQAERKAVLTQHRYGRISDEEMLQETARIDAVLSALPTAESRDALRAAQLAGADTLAKMRDYWQCASAEQRAEAVRLLLQPGGLAVDLSRGEIVRIKPRPALLPTFAVMLGHRWSDAGVGWLARQL